MWTNGKQVNEHTVAIWVKDKDQLKQLLETSFMEGLVDPNPSMNVYTDQPKNAELQPVEEAGDM